MTTFTSVQNGDWDAGETWGNGSGGDYPTKTTADDVANIGHQVTYNIDNSSGNRMGNVNIQTGGELYFDTTASTYLKIRGKIDLQAYNSEFHIATFASPLSSSYTCTIEYDLASDGANEWLDYSSDGVVISLHGAVKTQREELSTTANASQADLVFSTIPADWAAGDRLVVLSDDEAGTGRYTETEEVEISSISSNTATLTGNLSNQHSAGTVVMNMTRNIRLFATNSSYRPSGSSRTVQFWVENVEFDDIGSNYVLSVQDRNNNGNLFKGCTVSGANDSIYVSGMVGCMVKDCNFYNAGSNHFDGQNTTGSYEFINCMFVDATSTCLNLQGRGGPFRFYNCVIACNASYGVSCSNDRGFAEFVNCYFYGNQGRGVHAYRSVYNLYNCVFGEREDGTSQTNGDADMGIDGGFIKAHDCLFNSSDTADMSGGNGNGFPMIISSNHNQTAGSYRQFESDTTYCVQDDATTYRTSAPSIKLNCTMGYASAIHKIPIQVSSGDNVSIEIYGKASSSTQFNEGKAPWARVTGCGIKDDDEWDVSDTNWNALTLTGTASRGGVILCEIGSPEEDADFYIDDITVTIT